MKTHALNFVTNIGRFLGMYQWGYAKFYDRQILKNTGHHSVSILTVFPTFTSKKTTGLFGFGFSVISAILQYGPNNNSWPVGL